MAKQRVQINIRLDGKPHLVELLQSKAKELGVTVNALLIALIESLETNPQLRIKTQKPDLIEFEKLLDSKLSSAIADLTSAKNDVVIDTQISQQLEDLQNEIGKLTDRVTKLEHDNLVSAETSVKPTDVKPSGMTCIHCGSSRVIRNGFKKNIQRFLCKNCGRSFSQS